MSPETCPTCGHTPRAKRQTEPLMLPDVRPVPTWIGSDTPTYHSGGRFEYAKGKLTKNHLVWDRARGGPVTVEGYSSKAHAVKVADALNGETPADRAARIARRIDWTPALAALRGVA